MGIVIRNRFLAVVAVVASMAAISGCSGRNLHPELNANTGFLTREWTFPTHKEATAEDRGFEFSNPVAYENTLILGNQSVGLISIYPGSAQVRWVLPVPNGVVSPLGVDRDSLYFGGGDGFLYSVNADTGRVNWRYDLHNPLVSLPAVSGGRLFVTAADDTVYAFDAATGKWLWHYRRRTAQTATVRGASSPLVDGDDVIVGLSDGFLIVLSVNDGQLKWEKKLHQGTKFTDVDAHPVLDNGVIYIPSFDGALYALKRQDGNVIWRYDSGGSKQAVMDGDRLFFPSSDGTVYALQKDSSKVIWKFELDGGVPTQIAAIGKYLVVGSSHQFLYLLDKNTGAGLFRFNAGYDSGFYGSPLAVTKTNKVYALSSAGNLYSFRLKEPKSK